MRQAQSFLKLDTRRLLTLVFFVLLFTMAVRELRDPDFWWHLATGRYICQTGSIPRHDVFSYTVLDHRWITHEWLSQVVIWTLYLLGGLPLLILVAALVINWAMISLAHLKFRRAMQRQGVVPSFKAFWFPFSNYLCLAFVSGILVIMLWIPGIRLSVFAIPFWVGFLWLCFRLRAHIRDASA